jgi:hypothetical protein
VSRAEGIRVKMEFDPWAVPEEPVHSIKSLRKWCYLGKNVMYSIERIGELFCSHIWLSTCCGMRCQVPNVPHFQCYSQYLHHGTSHRHMSTSQTSASKTETLISTQQPSEPLVEGGKAAHDAVAFSPLSDPKLNARPCDRLRIRTKPVIGPFSPSFSMLKLARASSPLNMLALRNRARGDQSTRLTKNAACVKVGAQKLTVTLHTSLWRETAHVC